MADVRYIGDAEQVEVPLAEGQYVMPRLEWVDLPVEAARNLAKTDDFELAATVKAARTRARHEAAAASADETPATGEEG